MGLSSLYVNHEADTASVMFECGVIETLLRMPNPMHSYITVLMS